MLGVGNTVPEMIAPMSSETGSAVRSLEMSCDD